MGYKVMSWKQKLFDELVSRVTFLVVLFAVPLWFVQLTPENERAYIAVAGLALGAGTAKTIMNGVKAKAKLSGMSVADDRPPYLIKNQEGGDGQAT